MGRCDVERREGGRRRPGCSAESMTPRSEREEGNMVESERDGERDEKYLGGAGGGKKARGVKGRGRTRGDRKVWKLTVTRRFIIAVRCRGVRHPPDPGEDSSNRHIGIGMDENRGDDYKVFPEGSLVDAGVMSATVVYNNSTSERTLIA